MKRKTMLAMLAVLGLSGAAHAQDYFDFDSVPAFPGDPGLQVDLNGAMLGFAAAAADASDPAVAQLLSGIEGVRVRAYPMLPDAAAVSSYIENASGQLEREGWARVVSVQDAGHNVRIYARMEGEVMNGLTIMALSDEGAAFVNVAGRITGEQLGRIAAAAKNGDVIGALPRL